MAVLIDDEKAMMENSDGALRMLVRAGAITAKDIPKGSLDVFIEILINPEEFVERKRKAAFWLKVLAKRGLIRAERMDAVVDALMAGLKDDDQEVVVYCARGLKFLAKAGSITAEDIPENDMDMFINGLMYSNLFTERKLNAIRLKELAEAKLIRQESVPGAVRAFFAWLNDSDIIVFHYSALGLKALAEDGLVRAEDIPVDLIDNLIKKLISSGKEWRKNIVFVLKALAEGKLINPEMVISDDTEQLFEAMDQNGWSYQNKILLAKAYYSISGKSTLSIELQEKLEYLFMTLSEKRLNKASIQQLMALAQKADRETMRQWEKKWIKETGVIKKMSAWEIQFYSQGETYTNFTDFMKGAFLFSNGQLPQRPRGLPKKESKVEAELQKGPIMMIDGESIDLNELNDQYGRTGDGVYYLKGHKKVVYFKFLKVGEDIHNLSYEYDLMNFFNDRKDKWRLLGRYPRGVKRLVEIAPSAVPHVRENFENGRKSVRLDVNVKGNYQCMVYETDLGDDNRNDYKTYLNDPDLSPDDEFMEALKINVHDRMVMAKHGLFDMEIIELFHNGTRGFDWMVDAGRSLGAVHSGAGQIRDVTGATLYPNLRLSGPADFPKIYYIGDLLKDKRSQYLMDNRLDKLSRIVGQDKAKVLPYITAAYLGDILLSIGLMVPTYLLRRNELQYKNETQHKNTFLQRALTLLFDEAYEVYQGKPAVPLSQAIGLNIQLMARQMAYSMPKKDGEIPSGLYPKTEIKGGQGLWDVMKSEYRIPSRNPDLGVVMKSFDLGPESGPNSLLAFIGALYATTPVMVQGLLTDQAQVAETNKGMVSDTGGIDLTAARMNVQVKIGSPIKVFGDDREEGWDDNGGIKFHTTSKQLGLLLQQLQDAPGFVPVIINIQPVTNLKLFLGVDDVPLPHK